MTKAEDEEITAVMARFGIDNRHDAGYFRRALRRGLSPTIANIRAKQERARFNAALPAAKRRVKTAGYYEGWVARHERCIELLQAKWRTLGIEREL